MKTNHWLRAASLSTCTCIRDVDSVRRHICFKRQQCDSLYVCGIRFRVCIWLVCDIAAGRTC